MDLDPFSNCPFNLYNAEHKATPTSQAKFPSQRIRQCTKRVLQLIKM